MTRIAMFAALALGLLATTAATCQTGSKPVDHVVDGVVDCASAGVHEAAVGIIDDAASALATGDWQTALVNLVKRFGEGAVDCAVAEIAETAGKHAAMNELEATKARRAKEWLASRPVKVSGICAGCGDRWAMRTALPFESTRIVFYARGDNGEVLPLECSNGEHTLPPFATGKVCVSNDFTIADDNVRKTLRESDTWMRPPAGGWSATGYEI